MGCCHSIMPDVKRSVYLFIFLTFLLLQELLSRQTLTALPDKRLGKHYLSLKCAF